MTPEWAVLPGDCLASLRGMEANSVQCCVTSPPYFGLRDYGVDGQIGLEAHPDDYTRNMTTVFREVRRVLSDDGVLFLNIGDGWCNFRSQMGPGQGLHGREKLNGKPDILSRRRGVEGLKEKEVIGLPWRVAFALQADGWYLRQDIIWSKPNPMPERVQDRCTKSHEYVFLLTKRPHYKFVQMQEQAAEGGLRNRRSVWTVNARSYHGVHFATMPPELAGLCILGGSTPGDLVLDPFCGSGTTGAVAVQHGRRFVGCELNPEYVEVASRRIAGAVSKQQSLF